MEPLSILTSLPLETDIAILAVIGYFLGEWAFKKTKGWVRGDNLPIRPPVEKLLARLKNVNGWGLAENGIYSKPIKIQHIYNAIIISIDGIPLQSKLNKREIFLLKEAYEKALNYIFDKKVRI